METPWKKFEDALRAKGKTFETIAFALNIDKIVRELMGNDCSELEIGEIQTEFKKRAAKEAGPPPTDQSDPLSNFKISLKACGVTNPQSRVIERILQYHSTRLVAVQKSPEEAHQLYEYVSQLPYSTTESIIEGEIGISLNGEWTGSDFSSLVTAADKKGRPLLVKVLLNSNNNETSVVTLLNAPDFESCKAPLVPAKARVVVIPPNDSRVFRAHGSRSCIIMPKFSECLDKCPQLTEEALLVGGERMVTALNYLHQLGFIHMDVKQSNIFIRENGDWYLGDFGSCVKEGDQIISTTSMYHSRKLTASTGKPEYDWEMLWFTLATCINRKEDFRVLLNTQTQLVSVKSTREHIQNNCRDEKLKELMLSLDLKALHG